MDAPGFLALALFSAASAAPDTVLLDALTPPAWQDAWLTCGTEYEVVRLWSDPPPQRMRITVPARDGAADVVFDARPEDGAIVSLPARACREVGPRPVRYLVEAAGLPLHGAIALALAPAAPGEAAGLAAPPAAGDWACAGTDGVRSTVALGRDGASSVHFRDARGPGECLGTWKQQGHLVDLLLSCRASASPVWSASARRATVVSAGQLVSAGSTCRRLGAVPDVSTVAP